MEHQRATSGQPRLLGLGGSLGSGAATGASRSSLLQLKPNFAGPTLRPGSLTSETRLGSTRSSGLGSVLPLRCVGLDHSLGASWDPAPAVAAAARCSGGGGGTPVGARPCAHSSPGLAPSGLGPSVSLPNGDARAPRVSAGPYLAAQPSSSVPQPNTNTNTAKGDLNNGTPATPPVHIQWLPPVSVRSFEPSATGAPKPLSKQHTRSAVKKQVKWLLPEDDGQEQERQEHGRQEKGENPSEAGLTVAAAMAAGGREVVQPPVKRPRLGSSPSTSPARTALAGRLGGLRQPLVSSPSPPLKTSSYNDPQAEVLRGWQRQSARAAQPLPLPHHHRRRRSLTPATGEEKRRQERGPTAGAGGGGGGWAAAAWPSGVPALATLTAAQWTSLECHLSGGAGGGGGDGDGDTNALHEALNVLTVFSFTAVAAAPMHQPPHPQQQEGKRGREREGPPAAVMVGSGDAAASGGDGDGAASPPPLGQEGYGVPQAVTVAAAAGACVEVCRGTSPSPSPPLPRGAVAAAITAARCHGSEVYGPVGPPDTAAMCGGPAMDANVRQQHNTACTGLYCDLQTALRAHPGVVCALWRLVGAAVKLCTAADEDPAGCRPCDRNPPGGLPRDAMSQAPSPPAAAIANADEHCAAGLGLRSNAHEPGQDRCGVTATAGGCDRHNDDVAMYDAGVVMTGGAEAPGVQGCVPRGAVACAEQQQQEEEGRGQQREGTAVEVVAAAIAIQLNYGACAANVLRNLAVAEMVPEQLLCDKGLGTCACAMEALLKGPPHLAGAEGISVATAAPPGAVPTADGVILDNLVASLLELLTALPPHQLPAEAQEQEQRVQEQAAPRRGYDRYRRSRSPRLLKKEGVLASAGEEEEEEEGSESEVQDRKGTHAEQQQERRQEQQQQQQQEWQQQKQQQQQQQETQPQQQEQQEQGMRVAKAEAGALDAKGKAGEEAQERIGPGEGWGLPTGPSHPEYQQQQSHHQQRAPSVRDLPPPPLSPSSPRPLLVCLMSLLTARSQDVSLRLRTLVAGLLASWLATTTHQPAVLQALLRQPHSPPPPSTPLGSCCTNPNPAAARVPHKFLALADPTTAALPGLGHAATMVTITAIATTTLTAKNVLQVARAAAPAVSSKSPLEALQELLTLPAATAEEDVRREVAAAVSMAKRGAAGMAVPALSTGVPEAIALAPAAGAKEEEFNDGSLLQLLAAWRRSDAIAVVVEVLYVLACGCGPTGRRLLASHSGLQCGLAALAGAHSMAAAATAAAAGVLSYTSSPLPSLQYAGGPLAARCQATLVAASEVAAEVLAVLPSWDPCMAAVVATGGNGGGDATKQ